MFETAGPSNFAARGQRYFGAPIGILMLDCIAPFIPGSVGNASTFSAPVRYLTIEGLTVDEILSPAAATHAERVVGAAQELERQGAQLIASNCGFMARFQDEVQEAVAVPVLLSSLQLVPLLLSTLPRHQKLGVLTASSGSLTDEFISSTGILWDQDRIVVAGLDQAPAFTAAFITCVGTIDIPAVQQEVVDAASALTESDSSIGALLLECSEFPPYAAAVQAATGLPVFDFTSMIEFFTSGLRRAPFRGFS